MFEVARLICGAVFIVLGAVMLFMGALYPSGQPWTVWLLGIMLMLLGVEEMYSAGTSRYK